MVSAVVANSTAPGLESLAVSAVTVTSPVALLTSIPSPAIIDVATDVPCQTPALDVTVPATVKAPASVNVNSTFVVISLLAAILNVSASSPKCPIDQL